MQQRARRQTEHPDSVEHARESALQIITNAQQPSAEVVARLAARGFNEHCITEVVDRLTAVGLIDDEAYASMFVRDRRDRSCRSRRAILAELRQRGLDPDVVAAALAQYPPESEVEVAARLADKKMRSGHSGADASGHRRRTYAALARRGFSDSVIRAALVIVDQSHEM